LTWSHLLRPLPIKPNRPSISRANGGRTHQSTGSQRQRKNTRHSASNHPMNNRPKLLDQTHFAYSCAMKPASIVGYLESEVGHCAACCKHVFSVVTEDEFFVAVLFHRCAMQVRKDTYLLGFLRVDEDGAPAYFRLKTNPNEARFAELLSFYPALFNTPEKRSTMLAGDEVMLRINTRMVLQRVEEDLARYGNEISVRCPPFTERSG
jgi:hypothetical protein